jgi:hypothetical protein
MTKATLRRGNKIIITQELAESWEDNEIKRKLDNELYSKYAVLAFGYI